MPPNAQSQNKRNLLIVVGLFVAAVFISIVWYIATHGILSVDGANEDKLSIVNLAGDLSETQEVKNGAVIAAGTYAVRNDVDGRLRTVTVTISGWLQTTKTTLDSLTNHPIQRIAAITDGVLIGQPGALYSYSTNEPTLTDIATHPANDPFGLNVSTTTLTRSLSQPQPLNSTSLVGLVTDNPGDTEGLSQLVRYDPTTNSYTKITEDSFRDREPVIITSQSLGGDGVLVFDKKDSSYTYYKNAQKKTINLETPAARNDGTPIVDINGNMLAVLSGNDYIPPGGDGESSATPTKDSVVTLYDLATGQKTTSFTLRTSNSISSISTSPEGAVAVIDDDQLWVYTKSGMLIAANPFTVTSQTFWRNSNDLYAVSADNNITRLSIDKRQLASVFTSSVLGVSSAHLAGNSLYFTSFNSRIPESTLPDGYVIDLSQSDPDKKTEEIINRLPIQNSEYQANIIGSTIYVVLATTTRDGINPVQYAATTAKLEADARKDLESKLGTKLLSTLTISVSTAN